MRLQRDSYAPKSCAFDAANVQFLRAHLCKSHPVLQQQLPTPKSLLGFVLSKPSGYRNFSGSSCIVVGKKIKQLHRKAVV